MTNISPITTITRALITALAVIALIGCAYWNNPFYYPNIQLQHPETGDLFVCGRDNKEYDVPAARKYQTKQCVRRYEEKGYIKVDS